MLRKLSLLLLSAAAFGGADGYSDAVKNVRGNLGSDKIITIPYQSATKEVRDLLDSFGADEFGSTSNGVDMRVPDVAINALDSQKVLYIDGTEKWLTQFEENFNNENFVCQKSAEECAADPDFHTQYQLLDAIHARHDEIAATSTIATIGSIGSSYEGRDVKTIFIGSGDKPVVLYFCGIHAREWLPPMFCTHMAEELAKGEHPILEKVKFTIVPVANPDGYVFSHESDNMWRKSRKPNPSVPECVGTDLNRNYDDHHCGEGASTDECSQVYCGVSPFDNVETQNLKNYTESLIASGETLLTQVDVHSYGEYWMSPYGWTTDLPPAADFQEMTRCMIAAKDAIKETNGLDFTIGSSARAIYVASGGSDDWWYSAFGLKQAYTIECRGDSFQPPPSNIIPSNAEIFAGMIAQVECAFELTQAPTPPPTVPCFDKEPNNIFYSSGEPAPCDELRDFCYTEKFVRQRCPSTCNQCGIGYTDTSDDVRKTLDASATDEEEDTEAIEYSVMIFVPLGVGLALGLAAACFVTKTAKGSRSTATQIKRLESGDESDKNLNNKTFSTTVHYSTGAPPSLGTGAPPASHYNV